MNTRDLVNIMASILFVAVVYMIVRDDKAQRVIKSVGDLFSGAIKSVVNGG